MQNKLKKITILVLFFFSLCFSLSGGDVEFPLVQSMSYFPYFDNRPLQKNSFSLSADMNYSNIFMFDSKKTTVNDMELFSNILAIRYGLLDSLTLELYYRASYVHGGSFDNFVMSFHEKYSMPVAGRDEYPLDSVHYSLKDYFSYNEKTVAPSSLLLAAAVDIYRSKNINLKGRAGFGLPLLTKPGFSSDKPFANAGLVFFARKGIFALDLSAYLSFYKAPEWLEDEEIKSNIFTYQLEGTVYRFFMGYRYRSTPFTEGDLAHHGYQLYVGWRIGKLLEIALVEDFGPFDTTPDVGFNLKINLLKK
ncbi:MAG: DUF3187 family protein [Candidatus Aminicenantes bacterium]|nr:DUF3187 family protein [Candidatus Aminicenantes bacterium]